MVKNSQELSKSFANRLAEAALSEDGARALSLFQLSGLLGAPSTKEMTAQTVDQRSTVRSSAQGTDSDRIGIWERKKGSRHFVRRLDMAKEWSLWANLGRIEPKRVRKRVVLIGESVARGYFYDPQFTPAMVLECMLQSHLGKGAIEVIDLARTDLVGFALEDLATSAALLMEPDAIVIFAGNNWRSFSTRSFLSGEDFPVVDSLLRERGVAGIKQLAEDKLVEEARRLIQTIASLYQAKGIPLLWIIPEFNLADWRDPVRNAPFLPGDANREWIAANDKAVAALLAGDVASAMESAKTMVELDGGVVATGFYLLAECSRRQGDLDSARRFLECARDSLIWDSSIGSPSPRPYSIVQKLLRQEPIKFKQNQILDLPEHFKGYLKGALPDRRLFLDYCHMTTEAIQVAMAAAASRVLKTLKGLDVRWQSLLSQSTSPSHRVEAEAAFLAAVHNAHWYQNHELVSYHCKRALQSAPEISAVMLKLADIQSRRYPMYMYEAAQQMVAMPFRSIQHYLFQMFFQKQNHQLDKSLLDAVLEALQNVGISASGELDRIRREEHAIAVRPANLLNPYYCSAAVQPQEALWTAPVYSTYKQSDYYKAYSQESMFFAVGERNRPILLSLTCRLPNKREGVVAIEVNGQCHGEVLITNEWSTWDITVPGDAAVDGLNKIVLRWPVPTFSAKDALSGVLENIRYKLLPEFYWTFGEVHSFTASDAWSTQPAFCQAVQEDEALLAGA